MRLVKDRHPSRVGAAARGPNERTTEQERRVKTVQQKLDRLDEAFEGSAFDGNRFNRTAATAPLFNYLAPSESADEKMVSRIGIEPTTRRSRDDLRARPLIAQRVFFTYVSDLAR